MKHASLACLALLSASFTVCPVFGQTNENAPVYERMDRLEHDIMLLQRQMVRGQTMGSSSGVITAGAPVSVDSNVPADAQLEVRLSAIEEELRNIRGKIEENEFQVKKLSENFDKLQRDNEFRFNELGAKTAVSDAPPEPVKAEPTRMRKAEPRDTAPTATASDTPAPVGGPITAGGPTTAGDGTLKAPDPNQSEDDKNFSTPRDHYNYAFRLLNQTKYDEAARTFDSFTKKYPKDPLVGNAFYWEGETYYIRRDYVMAADNFRQGFETLPNGPKAADNLLKLAMSLDALNRSKEACVVLGQITTRFKKSSLSVVDKAAQEQKRMACK
jgi:tol-pal system protein YbgF